MGPPEDEVPAALFLLTRGGAPRGSSSVLSHLLDL